MDITEFINQKYHDYWQSLVKNIAKDRSINLLITGPEQQLLNKTAEAIILHELNDLNHPDLHILRAENQQISIENVRKISQRLTRKPAMSKRHCVVIDMVDNLSISATNALLKTLEEPAGNCLSILLNQNYDKVIPTIKSRSFQLRMPSISPAELMPSITDSPVLAVAISLFPTKELPEAKMLELWFRGQFTQELAEYFSESEQIKMLIAMLALKKDRVCFQLYDKLVNANNHIINNVGANKQAIVAEAQYLWHKFQQN